MKFVHFICKQEGSPLQPIGVNRVEGMRNIFTSEAWLMDFEKAKSLIGGMIFLHKCKSGKSYFGGKVCAVDRTSVAASDGTANQDRVIFTFEATKGGRDEPWAGADHAMAWTSGIIEKPV